MAFVPYLQMWKLRFRGRKQLAQEFRKEGGMWGWNQILESQVTVLCPRPPCIYLSPRLLVKENLALPSQDFKRNSHFLIFLIFLVITNIAVCLLYVLVLMSWKAKVSRDPHLQRYEWGGVYYSTCIITVCLFFPCQVLLGLLVRSLLPFHFRAPPGPLSQARVDLRVSPVGTLLLPPPHHSGVWSYL